MYITTQEFPERNGVVVVKIIGSLDVRSHLELKKKVRELIVEEGKNKVLLNVSKMTSIDSTGLGVMVALLNTVRKRNGDLRLCGEFAHEVRKAFTLCGLLKAFIIYDNDKDGIEDFTN